MFGLGFQELVIVGIVAVLLFGKRLPEVARSLGKSYNEFRRGLTDIQSTFDYTETGSTASRYKPPVSSRRDDYDDYDEPTAPRFSPPPPPTKSESGPPTGDVPKTVSEK